MIGRRATIGLSLLSALLLCAVAAQSALATTPTISKNTTPYTCVKDAPKTGDFKDAHCDVTGLANQQEFKHVAISTFFATEVELTNKEVTESTKKSEPAILKGTIGLAKTEIECTSLESDTKESTIESSEPEAGDHRFKFPRLRLRLTGCSVKLPSKCIVAEPITLEATGQGVEGLEGPKGEKNAMGIEFVGSGSEETLAAIEFKNKGGEACSLNGKSFPVKGRVIATHGQTTESAQANGESSASLVFTPKFKMQTLKIGPNAAEFSTIGTLKMAGGNPISGTTTT